ncbi:hypothetical protein BDZ89DRAFT_1087148 [Hymenopellis radicata]|nr:hypothetical protein BDZ89DRAFT_1087148 [Hymenopellis radicata]
MTLHAPFPHPRDSAACARFRMSRGTSKRRERSRANLHDDNLLERITKLEETVSEQAALIQSLVSVLSEFMGSMNGALTSALSASAVNLPVPPSHPAPPPELVSPLPSTAPSSAARTDSMRTPSMHDVSNARPALPPELSPSTPHLSPCPAARQDHLECVLPGLKGVFKS